MSKKLSISEQCRRAGIDRKTYYDRLARGKTDLFAPSKIHKRHIPEHLEPLLKEKGISRSTYFARIKRGWSEFEAANVLPESHTTYYHNGKSVHSQLGKHRYHRFMHFVNNERLSPEEALHRVNNPTYNAKYYRDGIPLTVYCREHGLNYNTEYRKLMLDRKNANC